VERTLPYIEFQGEGSGLATDPIGRRAQSQTLSSISSSELGFLVDVRGFQGFRARLTVTGGAAGTVSIHAHLVKNSEGVFNAAMALVQTSDGTSGVPDFSLQTRDINSENILSELEDIASSTDSSATNINFITRRIDDVAGATDRGVAALLLRDDVLTPGGITPADGDYVRGRTDASGAQWVRNATVTENLFAAATASGTSATVDTAGYTMAMIHYTTDGTWDRSGTWAVNLSIGSTSPFKPAVGAIEVRQTGGTDNAWRHVDPESIGLSAVTNRIRGYMINVMGFQALEVELDITAPGTTGSVEFHVHLYSGGSGFNQEMSLGSDTAITPSNGGPPPLIQMVGGLASGGFPQMRALFIADEDDASNPGEAGIPAMVIRDDVLTAGGGTSTDLDYNMLRVDNFGGMWSRQYVVDGEGSFVGLTGSGGRLFVTSIVSSVTPGTGASNLGKAVDAVGGASDVGVASLVLRDDSLTTLTVADGDYTRLSTNSTGALWVTQATSLVVQADRNEDTVHTSNDIGQFVLGVSNNTIAELSGANSDYTPIAVTTQGSTIGVIINSTNVTGLRDVAAAENDFINNNTEALLKIATMRDDALTANAGTTLDGQATFLRVDNFGALWNTPTDGAGTAVFTAPVTLGDALANPTVTQVGAMTMFFNPCNATWERSKDEGSGLFVVQQGSITVGSITSSVPLVIQRAGDSVAVNTHFGAVVHYVRDDALTTLVVADGDYSQPRMDGFGSAWVTATDGAGNILAQIEDVAHVSGDPGIFALAVVNSGFATLAANGDYTAFAVTSIGASMGVLVHDSTVGNTVRMSKAEDTPSFDGTPGFVAMTVRDDALTANTGTTTDGDHTFIRVDNFGAAWTTATDGAGNILAQIEDVAHVTGDPGIMMLGVNNRTASILFSSTVGDYVPMALSTTGFVLSNPAFDGILANTISALTGEDFASGGGEAGMKTLVIRDDVLTADALVSADGDWTYSRVDNFGAAWTTATDGAGNILAQIEDVAHVTGDPGIMALGVVNSNGLAIASATGDYVPSAHTTEGYALSLPVFDSSIAGQTQMAAIADGADSTSGFHAGMVMLGLRDDVLTTATSADNDFTTLHTDSLGALWTRNHNAVQELGITELIGINEQVDAAEYSASVTTTLTGTGAITKVCLVATEDGSGAIQTPNGTLIIFDADPAIVAGDTAITAGERTTILAQLTFSSTDYQEDANGASNCQATEEIYHTSTLFATWFLAAGEPSFNDVAGDDEQFEMNVLYKAGSL